MEEERVFTEYEQVPKKRADCVVTTATLPENTERNRFRDVVPYEENRVELVPNKENNTGYINASHIKVCTRIHGTTIKKHSAFSCPLYNPYDVFSHFFQPGHSESWLYTICLRVQISFECSHKSTSFKSGIIILQVSVSAINCI